MKNLKSEININLSQPNTQFIDIKQRTFYT